ncbi:undecaprenyl diphosphate synthase family protein [Streptomyces sp. NPDC057363]|uniref:undecaprenyl diphosphate synthase family protein n=1 Tax=Streptomyces sp. NPDC057363 TaxID=3346107 RepID=UPI003625FA7C
MQSVRRTEHATRNRTALTPNTCVNHGGRTATTRAARPLARQVAAVTVDADAMTSRRLAARLHQPGLPEVDLLVRAGGEQRSRHPVRRRNTPVRATRRDLRGASAVYLCGLCCPSPVRTPTRKEQLLS